MSRYEDRNEFILRTGSGNDHLLKPRATKSLRFYSSPEFEPLTMSDYSEITEVKHVWKIGDRFYKLAYEHYGDVQYWWVIAKYNSRPTESHIKLGEVVSVPFPLETVIDFYRR